MLTSLIASVLVTASLTAGAARGAPCAASPRLEGDDVSVAAVGSALRQRGIRTARLARATAPASPACGPLHVTVARARQGIKLDLRDASGMVTERVVASADTAALLIESWLRTDITEPLLATRAVHHEPQPAAAPIAAAAAATAAAATATTVAPAAEPTVTLVAAPAPPGARAAGSSLGVLGELSMARDGSRGAGAAVTGCVSVGRACLGLMGRFAGIAPATADAEIARALPAVSGYAADGLVSVDYALGSGRVALRPGAALGFGWIGTRGMIVEHSARFDAFGPRAEARLAVDVAVGRTLAIELCVAGGAGPGATMDRVLDTRDRPRFVSGLVPTLRGGLGVRFGGGP